MKYHDFELANWNRKNVFEFFSSFEDPFFGITSNLDITQLHRFCKEKGHSFNLAILYYATRTANEIENFKLRLLNGKLVQFERIDCGTTVFHADETFSFCFIEYQENFNEFELMGKTLIKKQLESQNLEPKSDYLNLIHYSTIPWTSFTGIKHAKKMGISDTIPKITFGKYFLQADKLIMPISIEVNHSLMDGFHVGTFLNKIQAYLNEL